MKKSILFTILVLFIFILCTFSYRYVVSKHDSEDNNLKITVLDVGKADSIFLSIGDKNVLIDTGEDENGQDILTYLKRKNVKKLDYMIITHFDKDHVGGADIILNNIDVSNVIQAKYNKSSKQFNQYIKALNNKNINPISLTQIMSFNLNGVEFTIYPPNKETYAESDNDFSLVTSVKHQNNSFLFAGDAENERLQELLRSGNLNHTFLKVPHHGRYNSNSEKFLYAVNPKYAAITCSKKNPADSKILSILDTLSTKTYLTTNGDIKILSDGNSINVSQ